MWWYVAGCLWCTSVGFASGLICGWCSTEPKLTERLPLELGPNELFHSLERLRPIDLHPVSRN